MIIKSNFPKLYIPQVNFAKFMLDRIKSHKEKKAIISADDSITFTYDELFHEIINICEVFKSLKVSKDDFICFCLPNIPQFVSLFLATACCGATVSTCNPLYTEDEIRRQLITSRSSIVFVVPQNAELIKRASKKLSFIKKIIVVGDKEGFLTLQFLLKNSKKSKTLDIIDVDVYKQCSALPYSSGTTGTPKGVALSHYNFVSTILISRLNWPRTYNDVEYLVLPVFHIYGMIRAFSVLDQGSTLILQQRFSLDDFGSAVETYKVTIAPLVPPMLLQLSKNNLMKKYEMKSLKELFVAAAPVPVTLVKSVTRSYKCLINQGWGMTETTGLSVLVSLMGMKMASDAGSILCSMHEAKIVDPNNGERLGVNKTGELLVRGPSIMMRYQNNSEATQSTLEGDGFLHTGDLAYIDENERIFLVGRLKELIKYKGFQVAPAEIEEILLAHEDIADAAVVGIPDDNSGEIPKAFIVKKSKYLTTRMVHLYISKKLSSYKHLKGGIRFVDFIPKSDSGKILRLKLKEMEKIKSKI